MTTIRKHKFEQCLTQNPELAAGILRKFGDPEPELVIKTSATNADRAIARAYARAVLHGECWRVELEGNHEDCG